MKQILVINAALTALCLVADHFYAVSSHMIPKAIASGSFLLMALINYLHMQRKQQSSSFHWVLLLGLTFAAAADIALDISFLPGAALFALGHVFYFIAQCRLIRFHSTDLLLSSVLGVSIGLFLWFYPGLTYPDASMRYIAIGYGAVISLMAGKSISDWSRIPSVSTAALAAGCCLFLFSDFMLALDWFMGSQLCGNLCLFTYYPAECILAASLLLTSRDKPFFPQAAIV